VIRQLQKCDSDYVGWMMLAELYANRFNDLAEADRVVRDLCHQTDITREQMCDALHRLATWHLRMGKDAKAACAVLEEICHAFPGTHYADVARERIRQLSTAVVLGAN
jgi:TolA-binding protein